MYYHTLTLLTSSFLSILFYKLFFVASYLDFCFIASLHCSSSSVNVLALSKPADM